MNNSNTKISITPGMPRKPHIEAVAGLIPTLTDVVNVLINKIRRHPATELSNILNVNLMGLASSIEMAIAAHNEST